jgi:hypothetical protein
MKNNRVTKTQILDWLEANNNYYDLPVDLQKILEKLFATSSSKMMFRFSMILLASSEKSAAK